MKLLDQVRRACRTKHLSLRTEKAYVRWTRRFVLYHGTRHPLELDEANVRAFLTPLAVERQGAASTQNQALSALLFLYTHALERPLSELGKLVRARRWRRGTIAVRRPIGRSSMASGSGRRAHSGDRLREGRG